MTLITIREQSMDANAITGVVTAIATMSFDHGPEYSITVSDPFSKEEEAELEWYFEEHLRDPFQNQVRVRRAAENITHYGEQLFEQVFADQDCYAEYRQCIQNGLNTLQIEIIGSSQFHRWHWEALKDPQLPKALVLYGMMVRKSHRPRIFEAVIPPSPTINLLVVVARPFGKEDVSYRTISRPLVETLRQARVPVQIDIVRPGTYQALDTHLRETASRHGVGYYHVIHFDVHGAVLSYENIKRGQQAKPYLYHPYGRTPIEPYEGQQAFLLLEDQQENKPDLVRAQDLANLLLSYHIPIAILNACQSGKEPGTKDKELSMMSESSLGSCLMQAGVQLMLVMGYSVTVSAAELLMRTFYQQLFDQHELTVAISHARQELYNNKERQAYFGQKIHLEDWLLPVVYQNQPQHLTTRKFTSEEEKRFYEEQANRYMPPSMTYSFVGRDLDILQLEKLLLLTKRNIVLIRGIGGMGKTTLLHHLGWWWQTTGFIEQVFYFDYDESAWTLQRIISTLAQQLFSQVEYLTQFQPLSPGAQRAKLVIGLCAERHLLILDNLESITGNDRPLSQDEQDALRRFLADLKDGRTCILLGSRTEEAWLKKDTFGENVYELSGLDPEATSALTDRILERYQITRYWEEEDLQRLIKLLDGVPCNLEEALSNLTRRTLDEVLTALQEGKISSNGAPSMENAIPTHSVPLNERDDSQPKPRQKAIVEGASQDSGLQRRWRFVQSGSNRLLILVVGIIFLLLFSCIGGVSLFLRSRVSPPSQTSHVIKIAYDLPLSSESTADGKAVENGIIDVIRQANSQNLIPGYQLEPDRHDDAGPSGLFDPQIGKYNIDNAIGHALDAAIVGPLDSGAAEAEMRDTNVAPIALISPSNTYPCLTKDTQESGCAGNNDLLPNLRSTKKVTYFRLPVPDDIQAKDFADYLLGVQCGQVSCYEGIS